MVEEKTMKRAGGGEVGFVTRRGFLQVAAAMAVDFPLPRWLEQWRALGKRPPAAAVTSFITPNEDFYLVAVDPSFRPALDADSVRSGWALELAGVTGRTRSYRYEELLARATRKVDYTFECIGNEVGGTLIGNAQWHVIPLKELLSEAPGGRDAARSVMFVGLDDFYSSVSAQRALDDYAFLALRMNGVPLPGAHGFPARVILPNLYGMKQPRWLRRIALQPTADTTSFWEARGWAGEVPVKTMSRLDPRREVRGGGPVELTGIGFAGQRGVSRVEVSLDGGTTWVDCEPVTARSPGVWTLWRYRWSTPTPGRYTLEVRATDGDGQRQTARRQDPFPDGASGYDRASVTVTSPG
jgi:DMSO/TMAO reductase YedYZ molybdopterin-dependent catalytic subunit